MTTSRFTRGAIGGEGDWLQMGAWFVGSLVLWAAVDWTVHLLLHSGRTVEVERSLEAKEGDLLSVPEFAKPPSPSSSSTQFLTPRRPFIHWLRAWLGREILAFPIWAWAVWGGVSVTWRERRFWVGWDMKVHEILETSKDGREVGGAEVLRTLIGRAGEIDRSDKEEQTAIQRKGPRKRMQRNEKGIEEGTGEVGNGHAS